MNQTIMSGQLIEEYKRKQQDKHISAIPKKQKPKKPKTKKQTHPRA